MMSDNSTNNRNVKTDEIDLIELFNKIGRWIKKISISVWKGFLISIVFLIKRWLPLTLSIIIGVVLSYIMMNKAGSVYTTDLVLRNNIAVSLPNDRLIAYINRLQSMSKDELATTLEISNQTSEIILSIGAYWIIDKNKDKIPDHVDYSNSHDVYDTTNIRMKDRIDVSLRINSPQNFDLVKEGIIKYIERNSDFRKTNQLRIEHEKEMLERISIDIQQLDSLQKLEYFEAESKKFKTGGQVVFVQEQGTQLYYNNIHDLFRRKQTLEDDILLYNNIVSVINDFSIPTMRVNSLSFYLKKNVPPLFIVMLLVLIVFANFKRIREVYQKY